MASASRAVVDFCRFAPPRHSASRSATRSPIRSAIPLTTIFA